MEEIKTTENTEKTFLSRSAYLGITPATGL